MWQENAIFNYQSNGYCDVGNKLIYNTEVLKSNIWGNITIIGYVVTEVAFKNCAPFTKPTTKIDEAKVDDAENLYLIMPMYNLLEYSSNYFNTTGSLRFYSKD